MESKRAGAAEDGTKRLQQAVQGLRAGVEEAAQTTHAARAELQKLQEQMSEMKELCHALADADARRLRASGIQHDTAAEVSAPCIALPCLTLPCIASPCLALPCLALFWRGAAECGKGGSRGRRQRAENVAAEGGSGGPEKGKEQKERAEGLELEELARLRVEFAKTSARVACEQQKHSKEIERLQQAPAIERRRDNALEESDGLCSGGDKALFDAEASLYATNAKRVQLQDEADTKGSRVAQEVFVASPLTAHYEYVGSPFSGGENYQQFKSSCPCCKRPLEVTIQNKYWCADTQNLNDRKAFVVCLWGANAGYAFGALVLGWQLRELSPNIERILLHTDDVPSNFLGRFEHDHLWALREVDYIDGVESLYWQKGNGFDGVFTKLWAWNQTDIGKVLLLDIDTLPLKALDELFELDCPAAMVRGSGEGLQHGRAVDGSRFFAGEVAPENAWCQNGGINAGVILLKPDKDMFSQMFREVTCNDHPSHVRGAGPEQDYLSRFFAHRRGCQWHHIDVVWNYQLHHVPFSLEYLLGWYKGLQDTQQEIRSSDKAWRPKRMKLSANDVKNVHFSGNVKLWHMSLKTSQTTDLRRSNQHTADASAIMGQQGDSNEDEALADIKDFANTLLSDQNSYSLWISKTADPEAYQEFGCVRKGKNIFLGDKDVTPCVDEMSNLLKNVTIKAASTWRTCAKALLEARHGTLHDLLSPSVPEGCHELGTCVHVSSEWSNGWKQWYEATILSVHKDGKYVVKYKTKHAWGDTERRVAPERLYVPANNHC